MAGDRRARRIDGTLRVSAALVGTLPVALLAGLLTTRLLPASQDVRLAAGHALVIPIWIAAIGVVALAKTGARAWLLCLSLVALLSIVTR